MEPIKQDLSKETIANRVVIFGSKSWDHAQDFITRIIDRSEKIRSTTSASPTRPIKLDPDRQIATWKLGTKYYDALLLIRWFSLPSNRPERQLDGVQAVVILWGNDHKHELESVLQSLSSSPCDSRLVIVELESEQLLEDNGWQETCAEHGFECYISSDVGAASMSWQCCPWPSIQRHSGPVSSTCDKSLLKLGHTAMPSHKHASLLQDTHSHPFCEKPSQKDDRQSLEDQKGYESRKFPVGNQANVIGQDAQTSQISAEIYGFEDEFSEFISAESSGPLDDEDIGSDGDEILATEVEDMVHKLFGYQNQNPLSNSIQAEQEALGDLESLVSQIHGFKLEAACMDDRSRKRLAARVAMAIERQLGAN